MMSVNIAQEDMQEEAKQKSHSKSGPWQERFVQDPHPKQTPLFHRPACQEGSWWFLLGKIKNLPSECH